MKSLWFVLMFVICVAFISAEENESAPGNPCSEDVIDVCEDGSSIITNKCIEGEFINSSNECPERLLLSGQPCDMDHVMICWDESTITTFFCVDSLFVKTNKKCPEQVNPIPIEEEVGIPDDLFEENDSVVTLFEEDKETPSTPMTLEEKGKRNWILAGIIAAIVAVTWFISYRKKKDVPEQQPPYRGQ